MRTETEQPTGARGWRRALRARYVALVVLAAGLAFVLLRAALAPDMAICGCTPPWFFDDLDTLVP